MRSRHEQSQHWRRDVRLLAVSRGISVAGAEAGHIALMAYAWRLTGSASHAALVLLAGVLARTFGAPLAGWIGDRANRRTVICVSELAVAAALCGMAVSTTLWQLLLLCFVHQFAANTCGAALDAALGTMVPADELAAANSTMGVARNAGHMLGPVLGGIAIASIGAAAAFLVDAATSVAAGLLVLAVRGVVGGGASTGVADDTAHGGMLAGVRAVAADPALRLVVAGWSGMSVCFAFVITAELPLAVSFGMDEPGLGMIASSWCAGSLFGSWLARHAFVSRHGPGVLVAAAVTCGGVFAATGVAPAFWCVLALMVIGGMSMAMAGIAESTFVQRRIEDGIRARVVAACQGVFSSVFGVNLALAGVFIDAFSARAAYVYGGAWCLVAAFGFWQLRRCLRDEQHAELVRSLRVRHALDTHPAESDLARSA